MGLLSFSYFCFLLYFSDKSCLRTGDLEWYFFCPREKKYASGARMNRATEFGYWKTTGRGRDVHYNSQIAGKIKTLVFHRGRAPHGDRTDWVMHEFRLQDKDLIDKGIPQVSSDFFLSFIFYFFLSGLIQGLAAWLSCTVKYSYNSD